MENHEEKNLRDEGLSNPDKQNASNKENLQNNNSRSESLNTSRAETKDDDKLGDALETDKYLAMEQQGVSYTRETPIVNSDQIDFGSERRSKEWNNEGGNSKYSDAFNQDDYLLEDNLDLDEDQNQSISSDDEDFEETNERY